MNKIYWSNKQDPNKWEEPKFMQFPFDIEKVLRWILNVWWKIKGFIK